MRHFLGSPESMLVGVVACSLALLVVGYVLLAPAPYRLPLERRRPHEERTSALGAVANRAATVVDAVLRRRSDAEVHVAVLERAGVGMRLQDVVLGLTLLTGVVGLAGVLLVDAPVGLLLALAVPLAARGVLGLKAGARQRAFAHQLDETLQLMSSSLRAGHSLTQALSAVARDADQPTSSEFAQIINAARVGRPLGQALEETAARMKSDDFAWVAQAMAINREAGGNLAEVLDGVGHTIRERNDIRRQVQSLSAEGKLSAYVLMALPLGVVAFLSVTNPSYLAAFTHSLAGYAMIGASVLLLVVGGLWLRKVVTFSF